MEKINLAIAPLIILLVLLIFWKNILNFILYFTPKKRKLFSKIVSKKIIEKEIIIPHMYHENGTMSAEIYKNFEYYIFAEIGDKKIKIKVDKNFYNFVNIGDIADVSIKKYEWENYYSICK